MNKLPLISVIVPVYKVENYLDRCVKSIVDQTYKNLEIILVDDGSPDNCPELCDFWAKKDDRIKVIHKYNEGLGLARNSGLKIANGDYIAFVDSDDYIDLCMYEVLIQKAISSNADIVYCGHHFENEYGIFSDVIDFEKEMVFEKEQLLELSLKYLGISGRRPLMMSVWHSIYRKEVVTNTFFFSEREVVSEDLHYQLSAILNCNRIIYLPHAYYYYCFNSKSLSHTFMFEKFNGFKALTRHLFELYRQYKQENTAYYFFFYKSLGMLRHIISNKSLSREKGKIYIEMIAKDDIWNECIPNIVIKRLPKHLRIMHYILSVKSGRLLYIFSLFDYYVVYRKMLLK